MQPCLARNILLYHLLYKYTALLLLLFFFIFVIQCYSEIHLNIMHTHNVKLTIGKAKVSKNKMNEKILAEVVVV